MHLCEEHTGLQEPGWFYQLSACGLLPDATQHHCLHRYSMCKIYVRLTFIENKRKKIL